jgi:hypothetical protein
LQAEIIHESAWAVGVPMAIEEPEECLLRTLLEVISRRDVVESEIIKLAEDGEISIEVDLKTVETPEARINKRKRDHRGRGLGDEKHRKFVDEVAVGEPLPDGSGIALGR